MSEACAGYASNGQSEHCVYCGHSRLDHMIEHHGYASGGEDAWILTQFPKNYRGYAVELGALDGTLISNTKLLEELGWTVLCIEPNPRHQYKLRKSRKLVFTCACAEFPAVVGAFYEDPEVPNFSKVVALGNSAYTEFEATVLTLDQCLMVAGFPRLDALSLDVDGQEAEIVAGFTIDRWKPRAVVIEDGPDDRLEPFLRAGYVKVGMGSHANHLLIPTRGVE